MATVTDLEITKLQSLTGLSTSNITDLRRAYYPPLSGLTPAAGFSIRDHMLAFYRLNGATLGLSFTDTERSYMVSKGATGTTYDDLALSYWTSFGPSSGLPVTNNLIAWFDASQIASSDGSTLAQWNDVSGNNRHLVQATAGSKPIYRSTTSVVALPNGRPVVSFDGVDDHMDFTAGASFLTSSAITMIVLAKVTPVGGFARLISTSTSGANDSASNASILGYINPSSALVVYRNGTTATATTGINLAYHSVIGTADGSATTAYTDGNSEGTGAGVASAFAIRSMSLAAENDNLGSAFSNYLTALIAEVIIYDKVLTGTERGQIVTYLRNKYGTP